MSTGKLSPMVFTSNIDRSGTVFQRFIKHLDWGLFLTVLFLCTVGLVMVYSSSSRYGKPEYFLGKQLLAMMIGMGAVFILTTLNYQIFQQYSKPLFAVSISLLALVLAGGKMHRGAKAWFDLGGFAFQPSEISKLLVILILAGWCSRNVKEIKQPGVLLAAFGIVAPHVLLILMQPDFGSTLVYFPILIGILFAAGANLVHLLVLVVYGGISGVVVLTHTYLNLSPDVLENHAVWNFLYKAMYAGREMIIFLTVLGVVFISAGWLVRQLRFRAPMIFFVGIFTLFAMSWCTSSVMVHSIKDYQRKRLAVFFNPNLDPLGSGYHVIQSMVALGSGKIFGKGLFSGTQGRLGFLPEQHTDFIFSVLGEELGFVMSGLVLLMYFVLMWRCLSIAGDSRDLFGTLVAVGIASMFGFYTVLNLLMVMGMAPVTGLPIPFLSYGGSALVSSLAAVGLLLSIHVRRYAH